MNPRFYFSTCQVGAEKAVKAEVLAEYPQLRFAFSRPGFVTFKEENGEGTALVLRKGIFTRLWGEVLAQTKDPLKLAELTALVPADAVVQRFDRDQFVPGEEPSGFVRNDRIEAVLKGLGEAAARGKPTVECEIYSFIWVDDFHVFLGRHVHTEHMVEAAGHIPEIALPEDSPSRAWLKIEEAFSRFTPVLEKGMKVLEVGCAPGGATTAMSNRGLVVTGIDPQHMDERVYKLPGFKAIRKPARFVTAEDLAACNPDILVMDMSIAPLEALAELGHVISLLRSMYGKELKIRQGFLTIKLNDWKYATEIPLYLKKLEQLGFHSLHPVQLCSNRQEFFVWSARFK